MNNSLLPPNASELERALEAVTARLAAVPVPLATLWNPATCPADLLPWLAWALSVDEWQSDWPESVKRAVLASSISIHRRKGTVAAVREALAALGAVVTLREWFQTGDTPHTFELEAFVNENLAGGGTLLTEQLYSALRRTVDAVKPVRSHYTFAIGVRFDAGLGLALPTTGVQVIRRCADAQFPLAQSLASRLRLAVAPGFLGRAVARVSARPVAVARISQQMQFSLTTAARGMMLVRRTMEAASS